MTVRTFCVIAVSGGEFCGREGDAAEHLAGVFCAAASVVAAFLAGNGVVQNGHDQLGFPLQPDDGELPQSYKQLPLPAGNHQRLVKQIPDGIGDLHIHSIITTTGIRFPHFGRKHHGIQNLYCEHQFDRQ